MIEIWLIIILSIIVYLILKDNDEHFNNTQKLPEINEKQQNLLYMMDMTHNIFEKHDIWYCIAFGTLLGAVRHWSFVPWDDDIDILIKHEDIQKIMNLNDELKQYDMRVEQSFKLLRFWHKDAFIDLFVVDNKDGKCERCYGSYADKCVVNGKTKKGTYDWWNDWFGFPMSDINEINPIKFHGLELWGPSNPDNLLKFWYKDNYLTTCKTHYLDHDTGKHITPKDIGCGDLPKPQL
jgi:hypothetical protein